MRHRTTSQSARWSCQHLSGSILSFTSQLRFLDRSVSGPLQPIIHLAVFWTWHLTTRTIQAWGRRDSCANWRIKDSLLSPQEGRFLDTPNITVDQENPAYLEQVQGRIYH